MILMGYIPDTSWVILFLILYILSVMMGVIGVIVKVNKNTKHVNYQ